MDREKSSLLRDVRAIDVGYFNVKFTHGRRRQEDGTSPIVTDIFPALAPVVSGEVLGLRDAHKKAAGTVVQIDGVHYYVGKDVDTYARGIEPREVSDDYCTTAKYLALLRGALNAMANEESLPVDGSMGF